MPKAQDINLKHDIEAELEWDPEIDARKIGVTAMGGVVTLTGNVRSYLDKWNAEKIVKRVHGVRGVANDIDVHIAAADQANDEDIVQSALTALSWNFSIPRDHIRVIVSKGFLTLEGDVEWFYQKRAAEDTVRNLRGVRGLTNQIMVKARVRAGDVSTSIENALKRSAEVDAKQVTVEAADGNVTLKGHVRSWAEHDDIITAAWAAPGVTRVIDKLSFA